MTPRIKLAIAASALAFLVALAPASAYAMRNSGIAHPHTQTPHDRTPTVHYHGAHSHHG
jgi:hypothetical protein